MAHYRAMHHAPKPAEAVVKDLDHPGCVGAFWGAVNATIHKGFGLAGTLTNRVMRDLGDLPEGYPILAGSPGPGHAFVHVESLHTPVTVFGLTVLPGDWVHADRHGALVIPPDVLPELAAAIVRMRRTEALILKPARAPGLDFARVEAAWTAFEAART
jgi:regulator of RNase E activity RraA